MAKKGKKKGGHSQQKNQKKKQPKRPSPEELERQRQIAEFGNPKRAFTFNSVGTLVFIPFFLEKPPVMRYQK